MVLPAVDIAHPRAPPDTPDRGFDTNQPHPINCPSIQPQLAAWRISGQSSLHREFLRRLQNYCLPPGGKSQARRTTHCSENGLAGVLNGTLIPFLEMSQAW